jgi:hypothetical protein
MNRQAPQGATLEMYASYIVSPLPGSYYAIFYQGFASLHPWLIWSDLSIVNKKAVLICSDGTTIFLSNHCVFLNSQPVKRAESRDSAAATIDQSYIRGFTHDN